MQLITFVSFMVVALMVRAAPLLVAPVDTPTLIQTGLIGSRFAPCLQAQGNYDGAPVVMATCGNFHTDNEIWTVVKGGAPEEIDAMGPVTQIRIFGDKCLDVTNGVDADGTLLQIWTCYDGNTNQQWQYNTADVGSISWAAHDKCVTLPNDDLLDPVVRIEIRPCQNDGQTWTAIPPR